MTTVHANRDEATYEFHNSIAELYASLEPPFTQLIRSLLDAGMTVQQIIRLVLAESEK